MKTIKGQITKLVKNECCNFLEDEKGNCLLLDKPYILPEKQGCKQIGVKEIKCTFFRRSVLPINQVLEAQLLNQKSRNSGNDLKRCIECGREFLQLSNRAKYCNDCATRVRKQNEAKRQRKYRLKQKGFLQGKSTHFNDKKAFIN